VSSESPSASVAAGPGGAAPSESAGARAPFAGGWVLFALLTLTDLALGVAAIRAGWYPAPLGLEGAGAVLAGAIVSPPFLVSAGLELLVVGLFARPDLDRRIRALLVGQSAILLLSPTTVPGSFWPVIAGYLGAGVFVALFVVGLQYIYRTKQLTPSLSRLIVGWTVAATLTASGWFVWHLYGSAVVLAVSVAGQMLLAAFAALPPRAAMIEPRLPWLLHPFWVFEILLFTFLAEFFLGALLDLLIAGPTFLQFIPFLPYSGSTLQVVGLAVYNGLWFGAAILASAWFLIVMGFTMGMLVVFKIRETRERALRYRLALMIAVYGLAAIYIPSLASSTPLTTNPALANLPVIGWGFGLRSGGPFESTAFFAILFMYAFVAVLTVLFGRKALCSVMCGAALLYQGTTVSEMRGFNQTSRVGRYFLGSQLSTAYLVASSLALVSLFATSLLGVLHLLPTVTLANGVVDTSALPLPVELYFGALWFAMFVSVPYVGTYNCATTGFCHWGALSIPFAKVGLFRLKVKDRKVCQACTTFDCAKACPVGLVDMPLSFRTTGEYRSTKCCGVGDCVSACPYGNMYHQDVRFWFRRRLNRNPAAPTGAPLPMAPDPKPAVAATSEPAMAASRP
jgi:polyferredoxin